MTLEIAVSADSAGPDQISVSGSINGEFSQMASDDEPELEIQTQFALELRRVAPDSLSSVKYTVTALSLVLNAEETMGFDQAPAVLPGLYEYTRALDQS